MQNLSVLLERVQKRILNRKFLQNRYSDITLNTKLNSSALFEKWIVNFMEKLEVISLNLL